MSCVYQASGLAINQNKETKLTWHDLIARTIGHFEHAWSAVEMTVRPCKIRRVANMGREPCPAGRLSGNQSPISTALVLYQDFLFFVVLLLILVVV